MAGMGNEIRQVVALRQMAGEGSGGVEHHDHRSWLQFPCDRSSDRADSGIRNRQDHNFSALKRFPGGYTLQTKSALQMFLARRAAFYMADLERCRLKIAGQAVPHLPASSKQRNFSGH